MPDESRETQSRKIEHIDIVLNKETQYRSKTTLFECIEVLPGGQRINGDDVDVSTALLGRRIAAPIFISGMTGGHPATYEINKNIAIAASRIGIPMGVGSQRAMYEKQDLAYTYDVKKVAGDLILIGNMGATKLLKYDNRKIQEMLDLINADMLALHTNPAQESVQPEGDIDFRGVYSRICEVGKGIRQPVILKEVGNGISKEVAKKVDGKVYAIDVQGAGGTTWVGVETYRSRGAYGSAFWEWGIPTALSVLESKSAFHGPVWASGGIRTPSDIVKAVAIGADMSGMAKPVLVSERKNGAEGVYRYLDRLIADFRNETGSLGFSSIEELKNAKIRISEPLASLLEQRGAAPKNLEDRKLFETA